MVSELQLSLILEEPHHVSGRCDILQDKSVASFFFFFFVCYAFLFFFLNLLLCVYVCYFAWLSLSFFWYSYATQCSI